jgi:hypothetical protein
MCIDRYWQHLLRVLASSIPTAAALTTIQWSIDDTELIALFAKCTLTHVLTLGSGESVEKLGKHTQGMIIRLILIS